MRKYYSNCEYMHKEKHIDNNTFLDEVGLGLIAYESLYCGGYHSKTIYRSDDLVIVVYDMNIGYTYNTRKTNYYELYILFDPEKLDNEEVLHLVDLTFFNYLKCEYGYNNINLEEYKHFMHDCYYNIVNTTNQGIYLTTSDSQDIEKTFYSDVNEDTIRYELRLNDEEVFR